MSRRFAYTFAALLLLTLPLSADVNVLRVTIATTATVIYTVPGNTTQTVLVRNPSAVSIYVGAASVTTANGFELATLDAASFALAPGDVLYGIVATGTQVVHRVVSP